MANKITNTQHYTDIANAIRAKNGESTRYAPSQMASAITALNIANGIEVLQWYPAAPNSEWAAATSTIRRARYHTEARYNGLRIVQAHAFNSQINMTEVILPEDVGIIGNSAFYNDSQLQSITLPDSITYIGSYAFVNCSGLTLTKLPASVKIIGSNAFSGCSGLTLTELPTNVTSIGSSAFSGCSGLTLTELPASVTSIGSSAFSECNGLVSIKLQSVRSATLGTFCFRQCQNLTKIDLSSVYDTIPAQCFSSCQSLNTVVVRNTSSPVVLNANAFSNTPIAAGTGTIFVPDHLVERYQTATNWVTLVNAGTQILPLSTYEEVE